MAAVALPGSAPNPPERRKGGQRSDPPEVCCFGQGRLGRVGHFLADRCKEGPGQGGQEEESGGRGQDRMHTRQQIRQEQEEKLLLKVLDLIGNNMVGKAMNLTGP